MLADQPLLARATLENLNGAEPRFSPGDLRQRHEFRHYFRPWPGDQDFGFVAEDADSRPVGAVWFTFFSEADPGYGFIDESIPGLRPWGEATRRGQVIGSTPMHEAIREARVRTLPGISLSAPVHDSACRDPAERKVIRLPHRGTR